MVLEEYAFFGGNSHRFVVHVHGFFFNGYFNIECREDFAENNELFFHRSRCKL